MELAGKGLQEFAEGMSVAEMDAMVESWCQPGCLSAFVRSKHCHVSFFLCCVDSICSIINNLIIVMTSIVNSIKYFIVLKKVVF